MRILFIAPFGTCAKQTVPRRMLPLARGLAQAGHVVEVLIPAWDCPDEAGGVTHEGGVMDEGGVTIRSPRLGPAPHPLADPFLLRRMRQAVTNFAPELVHVFKAIGYAGAVAGPMFARQEIPVIVDVDDLESEEGWGSARGWLARRIASRQENRALQRARGVTVASQALAGRVGEMRGGPGDILYLPNGVKPAATPAAVAENQPIVLLYTRGNDVDPERVAAVWRAIQEQAPTARQLIVGDWAAAPDLPGSERLGWLPAADVTRMMRGSAVAFFPVEDTAQIRAKSPARLLDCLAQGLPVVAANVGEYGLLPGSGGVVVEAGDDDALAAAVVSLLNDANLRGRVGVAAWERAHEHSWSRRVEALLAWYGAYGERKMGRG